MTKSFRIGDLTEEYLESYLGCLTPDEKTMREAGNRKADWLAQRDKGDYGVKLAFSEEGKAVGMIQYVRSENSQIECAGAWFVFCVWIPPKRRNSGVNWRKMGIGKALLKAAEEDAASRGATALVAWGTSLPIFMRSAWFKRQGYRSAEKAGISELVWKPFTENAQAPCWRSLDSFVNDNTSPPLPDSDHTGVSEKESDASEKKPIRVQAYVNGICPAMNAVHARFRRAADELGSEIRLNIYENAPTDAVFIENKEFPLGPPPSYNHIVRSLKKALRRNKP